MDRRFFLAIGLTILVFVATEALFKRTPRPATPAPSDSSRAAVVRDTARPSVLAENPKPATTAAATAPVVSAPTQASVSTTVTTEHTAQTFSNLGAKPVSTVLRSYKSLSLARRGSPVELTPADQPLLRYRLLVGADTVALDDVPFAVTRTPAGAVATETDTLAYQAQLLGGTVRIAYTFVPGGYVTRVAGSADVPNVRAILIDLPKALRSEEGDSLDDQQHLAFAYKPWNTDARSIAFSKLDPGERRVEPEKLTWVAEKNKYFLIGVLAPTDSMKDAFAGVIATGEPRVSKLATRASATVFRELGQDTHFAFDMYAGPQEWRRLLAMGRDVEHANPYGGFFRGIVQPFATIVIGVLLWMHETLRLNYGWVLVIFGIAIRLLLWPLYQSSMRTSMRLQRVQPQIADVQKRYKSNPQKQQEEIMRVYKEHGMTPFSPMMGCLPALLPMPVLFALFFVFGNTIEFRGVSFLWLPDIAQKDPFYILPVLMAASMFLTSWLGMRGLPPNPQSKMLLYMMPALMLVLFINFASGLNLYYTVQNLAALPQQWLLANERAKSTPPPTVQRAQKAGG